MGDFLFLCSRLVGQLDLVRKNLMMNEGNA